MPGAAPAVTFAVGEFFTAQEKATRKMRVAFSFYARVPRAGAAAGRSYFSSSSGGL